MEHLPNEVIEWIKDDLKSYPYEVFNSESDASPPKFQTWSEALSAQKKWNVYFPGHIARKRKNW